MRLYAWTRPDGRGGAAMVGVIEVGPAGVTLESCRDPQLATALELLSGEAYLPLTVRQMVGGSRHVRAERLKPGDPDYWRALAEGLSRRTGHAVTDSDRPPV